MSNTNYIVYRQEDEPKNKKGVWIHHKVYKDLSSPIVVQVYSLGMWQDINDIKPGNAIKGLGVKNIISLNKEEYESLVGKDPETLYLVIDYSSEEPSVSLYLGEMLVSDSIKSVTTNVEEPEYSESGPQVEVGQIVDGVLPMTFKHIQGPKGDTGDIGPKGEKGDQGNTGSSVDYPYELVNNVTTDDATKGLSAAQGVVLDGKISQLGQEIDVKTLGTTNELITPEINHDHFIRADGSVAAGNNFAYTAKFFVSKGQVIFSKVRGYSQNISIISKVITEGSSYAPLVVSIDSTIREYTYLVEEDGYYAVCFNYNYPWHIELVSNAPVDLVSRIQLNEAYKKYFIGKGNAFAKSSNIYNLKPGNKYRISLKVVPWDMTGVTASGVGKFSIESFYNGTATSLVYVDMNQDPAGFYDIVIPEHSDYVRIGGRAADGVHVYFDIYTVQSLEYITYGVARCSTAENVADKEITIPGFSAANNERVRFVIYMSKQTTVNSYLVVNGGSPVILFYNGDVANASNSWSANEYLDVTYNRNYPAFIATTRPNLKQSVNQESPAKNNVVSEKGLYDYIEGGTDKNVNYYNGDKVSAIVSAASRSPLIYEKVNKNLCPVFSVLTDLHSDITRFKRACAFADGVDSILATLCLGDLINTSKSQNPYPLILDYTKPVISITGNHEVLKKSSDGISGWSESDIISNMYNPDQVAHNGETHPTDKCYWYKDFSKTIDGVTKKLRVIGLHQYEGTGTGEQNTGSGKDVTFYSQDQIDWLIARLDEVDSNTWVMLLIHNAPTANMTRIECPFTPSESFGFALPGGSRTGGPSSMSDDEFIPKIIQAWIDGTTLNVSCNITVGETVTNITAIKSTAFSAHPQKFVGYFCGHTHRDFIGKLTNYPKQLQFVFICTSSNDGQQNCDIGRNTSGKTQDCFTLVGIDWFKNSVNLIRIGADTTTDMRSRNFYNIPIPTV